MREYQNHTNRKHYHSISHMTARRLLIPVLALAVILAAVFALSTLTSAGHTQAAQRGVQMTYESICISGGDTLWSIAETYHGVTDTAAFVEQLKALNDLSTDRIQTGSYLIVPVERVL